jgi:transposase
MLTSGAVLLHDNACLHTAACTEAMPENFNWELSDHPPYRPDLAPSDYHLFTYLKNWFGSQHFKTWLSLQVEDFLARGI